MIRNIVILKIEDGNPSGVVRYIEMLREGLASQNSLQIHIISLDYDILFCDIKKTDNEIVAHIPFHANSKPLRRDLYLQTKYFTVIADILAPYFAKKNMLLWHVQELFLVKLADLLSKEVGGMIITHLHIIPWKFNLENNENLFNNLYRQWLSGKYDGIAENRLERLAYPLSNKIICVSYAAKEHITSVYGIDPNQISVVYNGLTDLNVLSKGREVKKCEILFVGRVSKEKGVICLLNALKRVKNEGYRFVLNLVGQCSEEMRRRVHIEYNDLQVNVLGKVSYEKLQDLYSNCTIGIIPSLHEQCSYVAIEMSMFGVPMIVSDVDALSEMFENGVNALKIPVIFDKDFGLELDEEKLVEAVICLIIDDALRQKLSVNVLENYRNRFTLDKMIENTVYLYEQLMQQDNA